MISFESFDKKIYYCITILLLKISIMFCNRDIPYNTEVYTVYTENVYIRIYSIAIYPYTFKLFDSNCKIHY